MRAIAFGVALVAACSNKPASTAEGSAAQPGSAAQRDSSATAPTIPDDDPRLVGALDGCSAIQIEYTPYGRQPGPSPEAKRCAAVIVDESYRHAAIALCDRRCSADNARACYIAGALRTEFVTSIGLRAATTDDPKPRFLIRKFHPHNIGAPARFASAGDKAEATQRFARACELGDVDGCARPVFDRANAGADATEIIAFACKHGSDYACQLQTAK